MELSHQAFECKRFYTPPDYPSYPPSSTKWV